MSGEREHFDWRIWGYSFLAADLPPAFPGGPSHKAGSPLFISTLTRTKEGELIGFVRPRPAALAMNIAIQNAKQASRLRQTLAISPSVTPHGMGNHVHVNNTPHLYDFFEGCMVSVTFSHQALEIFCNEVITAYVKTTIPIMSNKKIKHFNKSQLQDNLSLKMKIGTVLPKIFSISSPEELKDKKIWNQYIELERVRNSTIHFNSVDDTAGTNIDRESLFFEFFKTDVKNYPIFSLDVIDFFKPHFKNQANEKWVEKARQILNRE